MPTAASTASTPPPSLPALSLLPSPHVYSPVTAVIDALKGRLPGGANEALLRITLTVDDPSHAAELLRQEFAVERNVGEQHDEGILHLGEAVLAVDAAFVRLGHPDVRPLRSAPCEPVPVAESA
jgi:hypothetical protein